MEQIKVNYSDELVLIVDDDPYLRETLMKLFEVIGMKSESAVDGLDALNMLKDMEYTIVLTDMKMPGIDGMELINKICAESDVNIIAMTGYSEGYNYVDVINAGASDFIKKPFGIEELEAKIRRLITERNLRKELNRLSITDSWTDLYNQRHFYSRLQEEVVRAQRQKHPLSLILLDLNSFKTYNDQYGHLAGDEVLRKAGEIIRSCIRDKVDSGYRYGGDEFAIILIDADDSIAREIGLRIENAFVIDGEITVSIGYSRFSEGMTVKDLVAEADEDLYRVKNGNKKTNE
jgi:two-component system, cell cycle response regulator